MGLLVRDISNHRATARGGAQSKRIEQWLRDLLDDISLGDTIGAFTNGDATPSVLDNSQFITAGATTITNFDDGVEGQVIRVYRGGADIAIAHDPTKIVTLTAANVTLSSGNNFIAFRRQSSVWSETERADMPILATGSSKARALSERFAEEINLLDWGVTLNSSAAATAKASR